MHSPHSVERRWGQPFGSDSRAPRRVLGRVRRILRRAPPAARLSLDAEILTAAAMLGAALVVGLATAADYGISIDEFNADDYGPKALAWYTSGFTDRSQFENVEFSLWYYGPWFQILTAFVQSFNFADSFAVRHALTFLVGLGGVAALLPIGRLAAGPWAGTTAIVLCLITGDFYGKLFFAPIDLPFLAGDGVGDLAHSRYGPRAPSVLAIHNNNGPCGRVGARHAHGWSYPRGLSVAWHHSMRNRVRRTQWRFAVVVSACTCGPLRRGDRACVAPGDCHLALASAG